MATKVWMRVGMELTLSDAELAELASGQCSPQHLVELLQSDRCRISGNSYFPEIEQNQAIAGMEWELPESEATRFFVETPDGVLEAYQTGDIEYPGIAVDIHSDLGRQHNTALSLTEYIPGGEGISDYDPAHPSEMTRQDTEVPVERRRLDKDGQQSASSGFVTRGWPNETDDQEFHHRIFHYGYKASDQGT